MSENEKLRDLVKQRHPFYEVLPYYVVRQDRLNGVAVANRRLQAGIDVDIYGTHENNDIPEPCEYALSCAAVKEMVDTISSETGDSSSIEVISFPSSVCLDSRDHHRAQGRIKIRISHHRGLDEPAGDPEQKVFTEIEKFLRRLDVGRR